MATREEIQALLAETQAALQSFGAAALGTTDELAVALEAVSARDVTIGELRQALADCQDTQPPSDPVPKGVFYRGDDMTLPNDEVIETIWGQWSREGRTPGSRGTGTIEWRTDGPVVNGVQRRCRRILKPANDRRNEIGQVNGDNAFVYAVGGRYVTRIWYRQPIIAFGGSEGERGNMFQMKHSKKVAHGGFGGDPISPAPPLSIVQYGDPPDGGVIALKERSSAANWRYIWKDHPIPHMEWWEVALDVTYAFNGHINVYFRREGEQMEQVASVDAPTVKENENGDPMFSTFRVGCYDEEWIERFVDVGPVHVERLG